MTPPSRPPWRHCSKPRMSRADAPVSLDEPEIKGGYAELGEYTVAFETHKADMDPAPLFRGLPDDRCQCPHWGVVQAGRMIFRYADRRTRSSPPGTPTTVRPVICRSLSLEPSSSSSVRPARSTR